MRRCVIFDLDGTLTASHEGILKSVAYAAGKLGFALPDEATLRRFLGPPLKWSFTELMGMSASQADEAVRLYRERYHATGLFENAVYPGIRRLLRMLRRRGDWVAIATGKPTGPSVRIIEHFGLRPFFDTIVGPEDSADAGKAALVRAALPADFDSRTDEGWMVGDRLFDIEAGIANGLKTAGALWGYGTSQELNEAGCDVCLPDVQALIDLLCPGEPAPEGFFVSMEGPDGSGKTTQLRLLTETLTRWGYEVVHSREPGGTPIGEKIRALILDPANSEMADMTEALLYAASRAQHVRQVIRPAIAAGRLLLCDRYVDSSAAYQGGGRELGVDQVLALNAPAVDGLLPLVTVYLDIPHEEALRRRYAATAPDRLEAAGEAFHARVETAYHQLVAADPGRFAVVNAALAPEAVAEEVARQVLGRLEVAERG